MKRSMRRIFPSIVCGMLVAVAGLGGVPGTSHAALAARVSAETGLALDPEYTGVFCWQRCGAIVYW